MKPVLCETVLDAATAHGKTSAGSRHVAREVAQKLNGSLSYLLGTKKRAVETAPLLAHVRDSEVEDELLDTIEPVLEQFAEPESDPEEWFVPDQRKLKKLAPAVLQSLGLRFTKPTSVRLPKGVDLVMEALVKEHRETPAPKRGRYLDRLITRLSTLGLAAQAKSLSSQGQDLGRVLEGDVRRYEEAAPKETVSVIVGLLGIEWTDEPPPSGVKEALVEGAQPYQPTRRYQRGESCLHPKFGVGWIADVEESSVAIRFEDGTTRKLVHARQG